MVPGGGGRENEGSARIGGKRIKVFRSRKLFIAPRLLLVYFPLYPPPSSQRQRRRRRFFLFFVAASKRSPILNNARDVL